MENVFSIKAKTPKGKFKIKTYEVLSIPDALSAFLSFLTFTNYSISTLANHEVKLKEPKIIGKGDCEVIFRFNEKKVKYIIDDEYDMKHFGDFLIYALHELGFSLESIEYIFKNF